MKILLPRSYNSSNINMAVDGESNFLGFIQLSLMRRRRRIKRRRTRRGGRWRIRKLGDLATSTKTVKLLTSASTYRYAMPRKMKDNRGTQHPIPNTKHPPPTPQPLSFGISIHLNLAMLDMALLCQASEPRAQSPGSSGHKERPQAKLFRLQHGFSKSENHHGHPVAFAGRIGCQRGL